MCAARPYPCVVVSHRSRRSGRVLLSALRTLGTSSTARGPRGRTNTWVYGARAPGASKTQCVRRVTAIASGLSSRCRGGWARRRRAERELCSLTSPRAPAGSAPPSRGQSASSVGASLGSGRKLRDLNEMSDFRDDSICSEPRISTFRTAEPFATTLADLTFWPVFGRRLSHWSGRNLIRPARACPS